MGEKCLCDTVTVSEYMFDFVLYKFRVFSETIKL